MLQDIYPHIYHSEYRPREPKDTDIMILQRGRELLLSEDSACVLPNIGQLQRVWPGIKGHAYYMFSIDEQGFYSAPEEAAERLACPACDSRAEDTIPPDLKTSNSGLCKTETGDVGADKSSFTWKSVMALRELDCDWHAFGGALGWHLASWYSLHRFCGHCGSETVHSDQERAIVCPNCGHVWYPRISPVVIIAITDKDRILLTRYNRNGYRRHALVAGFVEIGETFEDAVRREIMEEVGLRVKNIRYVESQPWPFSSSLIAGFQADVDGDPTVHLNTDGGEELAEAVWVTRQELEIEDSSFSLTWDMIRRFKEGRLNF